MKSLFQRPIVLIIFVLMVAALSSYNYYAGKRDASHRNQVMSEIKSNAAKNSKEMNTPAGSNTSNVPADSNSSSSVTNRNVTTPKSDNAVRSSNLNQFLMSNDEMATELKKFQQSGGRSSNVSSSSQKQSTTSFKYIPDCPYCHGTKTCMSCHGSGINPVYFGGNQTICPTCNGKGICTFCNGTGKKQ